MEGQPPANALPIKLDKQPFLDANFEVRFESAGAASEILPGYLFGKLEGAVQVVRLPAAEIPRPIREQDPALRYQSLFKLDWDRYSLSVSDRSLSLGCKPPYPGWTDFKGKILELADYLGESRGADVIKTIERYSLRYINLISAETLSDQIGKTCLSVRLADRKLGDERITLRLETGGEGLQQILQFANGVQKIEREAGHCNGIAVDIDIIANIHSQDFTSWRKNLDREIERIHQVVKMKFFSSLDPKTIEEMEPHYE